MATEPATTILEDPDLTRDRSRAVFADEASSRLGIAFGAWSMADFQP